MKLIASALAIMLAAGAAQAQDAGGDAAPAPDAAATPDAAAAPDAAPDADANTPDTPDAAPDADADAPDAAPEADAKENAPAAAGGPDTEAVNFEDGRWFNAEDIPTYKIEDGEVDYATFSGYRRYHSECHVCHGPDGEGSSFAPALKNSVARKLDYYDFQQIVASGKQDVGVASNLVMPAFGTNRNVWCYIDDIYTYLLARGTDAIPRGRPNKHASKSDDFAEIEDSCMSG